MVAQPRGLPAPEPLPGSGPAAQVAGRSAGATPPPAGAAESGPASVWAAGGATGQAAGHYGAAAAVSPWWSDALTDPWRDPGAAAAVVVTPAAAELPRLEPIGGSSDPPRRGIGVVVAVSVITALLAGALGGTLGFVFASRGGVGLGPRLGGGQPAPVTQRPPDSLAGVVKKVLPSVITVKTNNSGGTSVGSGFIVSSDGYAITNDHVVAGSSGGATSVTLSNGGTVTAKIVGSDAESDVAVLKLDAGKVAPIEFGDSDTVQAGDPVLAIGSPLALANTVTYGIVSAVDRPIEASESGGPTRYYAAIQTDAAVNHGNSGGPLVDGGGRVIGINAVIKSLASDQEQAGNVGLAFAIPINQAKRLAQDIIDTGKARRTVIGAELETSYRGANGGVRLQNVQASGPAANAGLKVGDVLTRIGGAVLEEPGDLIAMVRKYPPGTGVSVEYQRDGATRNAQVVLVADAN
jgi:putative serine protease PepD